MGAKTAGLLHLAWKVRVPGASSVTGLLHLVFVILGFPYGFLASRFWMAPWRTGPVAPWPVVGLCFSAKSLRAEILESVSRDMDASVGVAMGASGVRWEAQAI